MVRSSAPGYICELQFEPRVVCVEGTLTCFFGSQEQHCWQSCWFCSGSVPRRAAEHCGLSRLSSNLLLTQEF